MRGACLEQAQLVDQLIALQLVLPAEGIRVGALLDFAVACSRAPKIPRRWWCGSGRSGCRAWKRRPAARASKVHRRFGQADGRVAAQFGVDRQQRGEIVVHRNREGVDGAGRNPRGLVLLFGRQHHVVLLRAPCRRARSRSASAAAASTPAFETSLVAANPQHPNASTRIPNALRFRAATRGRPYRSWW